GRSIPKRIASFASTPSSASACCAQSSAAGPSWPPSAAITNASTAAVTPTASPATPFPCSPASSRSPTATTPSPRPAPTGSPPPPPKRSISCAPARAPSSSRLSWKPSSASSTRHRPWRSRARYSGTQVIRLESAVYRRLLSARGLLPSLLGFASPLALFPPALGHDLPHDFVPPVGQSAV